MKKTLIITLCCLVAVLAACKKKPVDPTPEPDPINYAEQYAGNYLGSFTLTILTMNNEPVTNFTFPIDSIWMDVTKGEEFNTVTATVTVDNESRQTTGLASEENIDFNSVGLLIDKPDQNYRFDLDLTMSGDKPTTDSLNINGTFTGSGFFVFMGELQTLDEVSGTLSGQLGKK